MPIKYHRVLIKLSGESLGAKGQGIDSVKISRVVGAIKQLHHQGVKVALVVGAGNWWRRKDGDKNITNSTSDYMGMLGIVLNALALSDYLKKAQVPTQVYSYLVKDIPGVLSYSNRRAWRDYNHYKVIILAAGTGKPGVTSDTLAAIRARDLKAEAVFKVGLTDGVYSGDPDKNRAVKKYKQLSLLQASKEHLGVVDAGAYKILQRAKLPLIVFKFSSANLLRASRGLVVGSILTP